MSSSSSSRCSSSASLASTALSVSSSSCSSIDSSLWKTEELYISNETTVLIPTSPVSFAISQKCLGLKSDLEKERAEVRNLTKKLEKAQLEESILNQKLDIAELEKMDIYNDLVKNEKEMKAKSRRIDGLKAHICSVEELFKKQQKEIDMLRAAQEQKKDIQKPWNYGESCCRFVEVKKNETSLQKTCDKKEGFNGH
ncbi:hypothetical protein CRE_07061 [Caenorhabditis remanei]|uniref:Uncharacterized protein n=1 Tax=Caenorhabditis remanei TaxID=31234 RepID=E3NIH2_CAERE|nr:hypothetical protein CRE_07061 [Caenorhabditis remanei]